MAFPVDVGCVQQQARIQVHLLLHSTDSRLFAAPVMAPVLPCASLAAFYSPLQDLVLISLFHQWSKVSRMPLVVAVATLDAAAAVAVAAAAVVVVAAAVGDIDEFGTECYTDSAHIDSAVVGMEIVETVAVVDNAAAAIGTVAAAAVDIEAVVQADMKSVVVAAAAVDMTAADAVVGIVTVVDIAIVMDTATVVDIEPVAEADTVIAVEVEDYTVVAAAVGTESAVTVVAVAGVAVAAAAAAAAEVVDWQPTSETQKMQQAPFGNESLGDDEADAGSYPATAAVARKGSWDAHAATEPSAGS